jgi:hypothetical protein
MSLHMFGGPIRLVWQLSTDGTCTLWAHATDSLGSRPASRTDEMGLHKSFVKELYRQPVGPCDIVHNLSLWAHTYLCTYTHNGPTWAFPTHTSNCHVGSTDYIANLCDMGSFYSSFIHFVAIQK